MKKLLALAILVLVAGAASAESSLYVKSLPIAKITTTAKGYKVVYLTSYGDPKVIYVPLEWFYQNSEYRTADGLPKAELDLGLDPSYPYIQFYWKDGAFHHLKIYARSSISDTTWGSVAAGEDYASHFDPTKPLDLKF
jgi:hypothetical protein